MARHLTQIGVDQHNTLSFILVEVESKILSSISYHF
jgi:hypothetical protein